MKCAKKKLCPTPGFCSTHNNAAYLSKRWLHTAAHAELKAPHVDMTMHLSCPYCGHPVRVSQPNTLHETCNHTQATQRM